MRPLHARGLRQSIGASRRSHVIFVGQVIDEESLRTPVSIEGRGRIKVGKGHRGIVDTNAPDQSVGACRACIDLAAQRRVWIADAYQRAAIGLNCLRLVECNLAERIRGGLNVDGLPVRAGGCECLITRQTISGRIGDGPELTSIGIEHGNIGGRKINEIVSVHV